MPHLEPIRPPPERSLSAREAREGEARPTADAAPESYASLTKARSSIFDSFGYAMDGVLRTLCTQRNMKIHWVSGLAVMLVGMALNLDIASRASIILCVVMVICMEVLNTSLEAFVDLHVKEYERPAMVAKDAAAAAVLVLAVGAVVILADVVFHAWEMVMTQAQAIVRTLTLGLPLLGVVGAVLAAPRRLVLLAPLQLGAVTLVAVLAWSSRDEIFSLGALGFVISAGWARWREPALLSH
jgi:diacylglycerol kinase (ATP)